MKSDLKLPMFEIFIDKKIDHSNNRIKVTAVMKIEWYNNKLEQP